METIGDNANTQPSIDIDIDWVQYFKDFCEVHGKYFVVYESDWLLFQDGYRYSAQNYEGPEIPPPTDPAQLIQIQVFYWERRRRIVRLEHRRVVNYKRELEELQSVKSAPLSRRVTFRDDDGKIVNSNTRLDLSILERRIRWLESDIQECILKLYELKNG